MFVYGMKLRGFDLGNQPMAGLVEHRPDPTGKYWDIVCYTYMLSGEEMRQYDLAYIGEERADA